MQPMINTLLDPVVNFGKATVSTEYTNLDTVIVLTAGYGSKLPDPSIDGEFNLVWYDASSYADPSDDPNVEIVRCTARAGDVLTILRAQEGTLASSKNTPTKIYNILLSQTRKTIIDIKTEYESGISSGISAHSALYTGVHGVGISTVESIAGSQSKVDTHANTTTAHGSVSAATASAIMQRDATGRAQVAAPSAASDIARKDTVDAVQTNLDNHANNTTTAHGTTGAIVGTTNLQALTNKTITDSTNNVMAKSLKSTTTTIDVSASPAPSSGQVLTATSSTTATWQLAQTSPSSLILAKFPPSTVYYKDNLGTDILASHDTSAAVESTSFVKAKTITIPKVPDTSLKIYYEAYSSNSNSWFNIYRNGIPVGTERYRYDNIALAFTETISGWADGDTLELWARGDYRSYVRNFRILCTFGNSSYPIS